MDGVEVVSLLWPDTVTVTPDPALVVSYYLEKDVYSDDPFTPEIEPPVPFNLGLMIRNVGYGTAYNMRITSGQPGMIMIIDPVNQIIRISYIFFISEITENEKGLLISFAITGAQLGINPISPSLIVNIGDLHPGNTTVIR